METKTIINDPSSSDSARILYISIEQYHPFVCSEAKRRAELLTLASYSLANIIIIRLFSCAITFRRSIVLFL